MPQATAPQATAKRQLLETLFPEAPEFVAQQIREGTSWRQISDRVAEKAGVTVSYESLRTWYGDRP